MMSVLYHRAVYVNLLAASAALAVAFIAQYIFHLAPCELCLMQRVPYGLVIVFGVLYACGLRNDFVILGLMAPAFVVVMGLAGFHVGVEQKWWEAAVSDRGCDNFARKREQQTRTLNHDDRVETLLRHIANTKYAGEFQFKPKQHR